MVAIPCRRHVVTQCEGGPHQPYPSDVFRLMPHDQWLALDVSHQRRLVADDATLGRLFVTSRDHELLASPQTDMFYDSYREVRPALCGPAFNDVYKFRNIVPGRLLFVQSFTSSAANASLRMLKMEHKSVPTWSVCDSAVAHTDARSGVTSVRRVPSIA
jgi:hypothetical protein